MTRTEFSSSLLIAASLAATTLASPVAHANDAALAEALFDQGKTLMAAHDYAKACPKLAESFRQDPATGTLLALAVCQEQAGNLASAWATYNDVVARAQQEGRKDREKAAREHAAALAPRLSKLTIEVPPDVAGIPGFTLKRDGVELAAAAWGSVLPIDPGTHTLEASAPGKVSWKQSLTIGAERDAQSVRVPALEDAAPAPAASPAGSEPQAAALTPAPESPPQPSSSAHSLRTAGIVVGAVGVASVGVGTFFGLRTKSLKDQSNADGHCVGNACDSFGTQHRNDARSAGDLSTVFFIGGAALLAGGVALFVLQPKPEAAALRITPVVARNGSGLWLQGGF